MPVFWGHCDTSGRLHVDGKAIKEAARAFAGKAIELVLRQRTHKRSLDQNAYWHAVPFKLFAEEWGESVEDTKLLLLGECFGWHDVRGVRLPVKPHTSLLTTKEGAEFTEWMVMWGARDWNLTILLPNEYDGEAA